VYAEGKYLTITFAAEIKDETIAQPNLATLGSEDLEDFLCQLSPFCGNFVLSLLLQSADIGAHSLRHG